MSSRLTAQLILHGFDDSLPAWRRVIFQRLFSILALLCIPVYITSVYLCVVKNLWGMAIFDTLAYGILLFILFYPRITDRQKFIVGCYLAFGIGIGFVIAIGPSGAGFFWLFAFPSLCGIMLGEKMALWAQLSTRFR